MQPIPGVARLMAMIAHLRHPLGHPVALELLLRVTAVGLALGTIFGLLPAIAAAAA